jgi:hypothetical protein
MRRSGEKYLIFSKIILKINQIKTLLYDLYSIEVRGCVRKMAKNV